MQRDRPSIVEPYLPEAGGGIMRFLHSMKKWSTVTIQYWTPARGN